MVKTIIMASINSSSSISNNQMNAAPALSQGIRLRSGKVLPPTVKKVKQLPVAAGSPAQASLVEHQVQKISQSPLQTILLPLLPEHIANILKTSEPSKWTDLLATSHPQGEHLALVFWIAMAFRETKEMSDFAKDIAKSISKSGKDELSDTAKTLFRKATRLFNDGNNQASTAGLGLEQNNPKATKKAGQTQVTAHTTFTQIPKDIKGLISSFLSLRDTRAFVKTDKDCKAAASNMLLGKDAAVNEILKIAKGKISAIPNENGLRDAAKAAAISIKNLTLSELPAAEDVKELTTYFKNLIKLDVSGCTLSDQILELLCEFKNLEYLSLKNTYVENVTADGFKHLAKLPNLRDLDLSETDIGDEVFQHIAALTTLTKLKLVGCEEITDFKYLASLKNLEDLDLSGTSIGDVDFQVVTSLKALTKLALSGCHSITQDGFKHLAALPNLQDLDLSMTVITDAELQHVVALKGLTSLELEECENITADGIKQLAKLQGLQYLCLNGTNIDDAGLQNIATLKALIKLDLEYCRDITTNGFISLVNLQQLLVLNVESTNIDDNGLKLITFMKGLSKLNLKDCENITMNGFKLLTNLYKLQVLNLSSTKIGDAELLSLVSSLKSLTSLSIQGCKWITMEGYVKAKITRTTEASGGDLSKAPASPLSIIASSFFRK
jgi:internalin A